jgi:hypothetical protein
MNKNGPLAHISNPQWSDEAGPGDWRYYVSKELRAMWATFTYPQQLAIAQNAARVAVSKRRAPHSDLGPLHQ